MRAGSLLKKKGVIFEIQGYLDEEKKRKEGVGRTDLAVDDDISFWVEDEAVAVGVPEERGAEGGCA